MFLFFFYNLTHHFSKHNGPIWHILDKKLSKPAIVFRQMVGKLMLLHRRKAMVHILLPKLFWPTVRKKYSSDQEKLLKFEAEDREFAKILRSLEQ